HGRGAALQQKGDAEPGGEGGEAVAHAAPKAAAQAAAIGAQDAGPHHPQPPDQERGGAQQADQEMRAFDLVLLAGALQPARDPSFASAGPSPNRHIIVTLTPAICSPTTGSGSKCGNCGKRTSFLSTATAGG